MIDSRLATLGVGFCLLLASGCAPSSSQGESSQGESSAPLASQPVTDFRSAADRAGGAQGWELTSAPSSTSQPPAWALDPPSVERRLSEDIGYLAGDELAGRGPFTDGLELAAKHIAGQFRRTGLTTERFGSQPYQVFRTRVRLALGPENSLEFRGGTLSSLQLEPQRDFTPLSLSGTGHFDLPLAFAGFGITCPELGIDDYAGRDVRGAMVIVLRHASGPSLGSKVGKSTRTQGKPPEYTHLSHKVANAQAHGAAGVLFVTDSAHLSSPDDGTSTAVDRLLSFQVEGRAELPEFPVLHCRRDSIDTLLAAVGQPSLAELERLLADRQTSAGDSNASPNTEGPVPVAALPGCRARGQITVERHTVTLKNVLGELPGSGNLADETLIVGAHYDHLGMGGAASLAPWTRAIHNGADDNASGTAALLEVARLVSTRPRPSPARRILFVAFSAEEMGLIGSEHFVASPPVPLSQVVAMVNLDMVGRLRNNRLLVSGTGTAREFPPLVQRLAASHDFRVQFDPSGYGPSDHATFAARGVPVLHFFTGLHEDYHRPSDDAERINLVGLRRVTELVAELVRDLSQQTSRPTPTGTGIGDMLADLVPTRSSPSGSVASSSSLGTPAPNSPAAPPAAPPAGPPAGTVPSAGTAAAASPPGANRRSPPPGLGVSVTNRADRHVVIRRVLAGSAAERAGLRSGDVILSVGPVKVATVSELLDAVRQHSSPARAMLRIERGTSQLEIDVAW